ncbi:YdeI/OmpD-associated family protein [Paenibacillus radicis (ex Xue et al. 2023)]|uniref:YdeI/OmpD-associated family protein n=1 Tax=Paenibacillus radicis (ex Xue et al. 2023) TaxID=2972489 RepID=A0ABT1YNE9_9BACL|nr:YdeI/OmpD-associated family protein [Paenibacillus radicis (ex Xue et al. 2023)]MCR8634699.1 YdeI/OmpD-associated family protein [Paenibacillus radicis (ex Xue et al. 2023)]
MVIDKQVQARTRQEWREWLSDHHSTEDYCWLITTTNHPVSYLDFVEEALCFGWIDSTRKKLDDIQTGQRFSPRKKNSNWSELNKERVRRLDKLGLMTEAGNKVLPDMKVEYFLINEAILLELRQDKELYRNFQALPELYVRIRIDNIQSVQSDAELYHKRLKKFIEHTRANKIYGQWNDDGRLLG